MKKTILLSVVIGLCLLLSCKKTTNSNSVNNSTATVDQTAPVITLKGQNPDTVFLGTTYYIDPGHTAMDNVEGDISYKVNITGSVSTSTVGNYFKTYNVQDAAGNQAIQITRTVSIQNQGAYLNGIYTAVCSCTASVGSSASATITNNTYQTSVITSSTINNLAILTQYPKQTGNSIGLGSVSITINPGGVSFFFIESGGGNGSGPISTSKTSFTTVSKQYYSPYPSLITDCKVVHTKN
jgi:hypothetical protein